MKIDAQAVLATLQGIALPTLDVIPSRMYTLRHTVDVADSGRSNFSFVF